MSALFSPISIRGVNFPNRVVVSPLCMYSAVEGIAQPWHMAHLSTFARGRAGLVFAEATAVDAVGRITPGCLGIWSQAHVEALKPITAFIDEMGSVPGIQLAHAGRKASMQAPFNGGKPILEGAQAWQVVGPSAIAVAEGFPVPRQLTLDDIAALVESFAMAARRSIEAGFKVIELHAAHGYLIHSFLSPISNQRDDDYGGDIQGRMRFALEVSRAVRAEVGEDMPLFMRISAVDGIEGGWTMDDSVLLARELGKQGIDVVDCSSGGVAGAPRFRADDAGKPLNRSSAREAGFQVPYATAIRQQTDLMSMAVGVIVDADQAESIIDQGEADFVALGREIMHDPFWPLHAAQKLGVDADFKMWPKQYAWAVDRRSQIAAFNPRKQSL
ncbi:MAG: 2,4-dienoyl-CoA reductase-like NADH-dependent reductase (Old Yellow Enzyme family) [Gammaproteobacteria bacterium]|jgi:2,4-dienoyl-CoA reductase-like NADH-dependent reductase (Old Yellow Enzyme family)